MQDWKRFEHLVALIHEKLDGPHFTVTHDVTLVEPTGATHQIDILLTPKSAFMGPVLVSCKSSSHAVGPDHVREWADVVQGTGASAGVIVSPTGFTRDALNLAKSQTRRLSLWKPRLLNDDDFGPSERSSNGYLRSVHITMQAHVLYPRRESFALDCESSSGQKEGRTLTFTFSAQTRERYYLRDANDNTIGNLWDQYIEAAEALRSSGTARIQPSEPQFLVLDGHRVRFKSLSLDIDVSVFELPFEIDLAKSTIAYENAVTGVVKMVPLPPGMFIAESSDQ